MKADDSMTASTMGYQSNEDKNNDIII